MKLRPKRFYRHMTPERAAEIRRLYFSQYGRITQREIGERFGMPQGSVSRIVSGQVWGRT